MSKLNFFDVDKCYINFLKKTENDARGFTCIPDVVYGTIRKFLCGIVLVINDCNYYVPLSSNKNKSSESILIEFTNDRYNQVKGSLRFNYMFPVPNKCITERIIRNEPDLKRRLFLNSQLQFCNDNITQIQNQAKRTYTRVVKNMSPSLTRNSCDFLLLEKACKQWESDLTQ